MCLAGLAIVRAESAATPPLDEYQVKAAYLYNLAKFVEWPEAAFASPSAPLIIGIYGADPFGVAIDRLVQGKSAAGRPLQVRRSNRMQDLRNSQIVFVGESAEPLPAALAHLGTASALTVGQSPEFLSAGGVVLFQLEDGRVTITIDQAAAARARLVISSQLLRLARLNTPPRQ